MSVKRLLAGIIVFLTTGFIQTEKHAGATHPGGPRYSFHDHILPILHAKCEPCHFEGGKLYAKLPFTDSVVVAKLGARLTTRLKDSTSQAIILDWSSHYRIK